MPWYVYALTSALFFASQELLMRMLAIKSDKPRIFSVVFNMWGALFALTVFLLQRGSFTPLWQLSPVQILLIFGSVIAYGLYERYQFTARKHLEASTLSIIFRLETGIAFIGSIIFLHEALLPVKAMGTTLIITASLLLIYKNPHFKLAKPFFYAVFCAMLLGIAMIIDKPASANIQPALYSFLMWFCPMIIIAFPHVSKQQIVKEFRIGGWKVALAAFLNTIGYILYIQAFALADASRVIPVIAINSILVVLGGIIILKERDHLWRKIAAGIIAFIGVVLLR